MPRIRQNIVTGEWSVVAPERAKRPDEFAIRPFASTILHDKKCSFCVGGEVWQTRLKEVENRYIYVIPNKFPAFQPEISLESTGHNFYQDSASVGQHEVVVMCDPKDTLPHLTPKVAFELLSVLQERAKVYEQDTTNASITPIYNHGHEAGTSVAHPHAQSFANAIIPPRLGREFFGAEQYWGKHQKCVFCQMIKFELRDNERIIVKHEGALAFAAFAPRFPFETLIVPTAHTHSFANASGASLMDVAQTLTATLHSLVKKLHDPPLNWYIHTARHIDHHLQSSYHWHIEITPRLTTYGGYELATDMIIETVLPEIAAEFLRS